MSNDTPTDYDRAQHLLVCNALNVSPDPNAPGDTAYEAVNRLIETHEVEMKRLQDKIAAIRELVHAQD